MSNREAWITVGLDIWNVIKYVLPFGMWMLVPSIFHHDANGPHGLTVFPILFLIITIAVTYWSYQ